MRVAVLNVHGFADAPLTDFALFFGGIACDVIALHEVPGDQALPKLASTLGMQLAYAPAAFAGNALLSRTPLVDVTPISLTAPRAETRSAIVARVRTDGDDVVVAAVHLDHKREVARLMQLNQLTTELDRIAPHTLRIVAGDFNALRFDDYPPAYLDAIRAHRAKHAWEPPQSQVTSRMSALGYVDALDLTSRDRSAPLPPNLARTCWAGTRIDYVYTRGPWTKADVVVADVDLSDHRPLVVTLT
jgi:endonuclease/exonuclease/phosphatase family metal-dependent hydrolase